MSSIFDLIIIGGGSGGVACSRRAAEYGAKVALIEGDRLGGTCVIRGCIPKKLMMYAGNFNENIKDALDYGWEGINLDSLKFNASKWQQKKTSEIDRLEKIYSNLLVDSNVNVFKGFGILKKQNTVKVNNQILTGKKIVIATGGRPRTKIIPGLDNVLTSNEILDINDMPKNIGILGSGYIAMEFACILKNLGVSVSVFFRSDLPLKGFDQDIRIKLSNILRESGINLHPNSKLKSVTKENNSYTLHFDNKKMKFEKILNALGRSPNLDSVIENIDIKLGSDGEILVNEKSETSQKDVFAIGDVTNRVNLTPVAIEEGRALAENEFNNKNIIVDHKNVASAVFTSPPIGTIGLTEKEAKEKNMFEKIRIYESEFNPMKKSFSQKKKKIYIKLIVQDKTDEILGAHILGDDAPEIIQALAVPFKMKMKKKDLDNATAVHPTTAEELVLMRNPSRFI